jgi:two-component system sensor histidine kinase AgrC
LNAIASFVLVAFFFFAYLYFFEYAASFHGGHLEEANAENPVADFLVWVIAAGIVIFILYFVIKNFVSEPFKYRILSSLKSRLKMRERRLEHQRLLEYTEQLELMYGELSSFRHDYLNILTSLESGIREKNIEMIEEVYYQVIGPTRKLIESNEFDLGQLRNLEIPAVKSILSAKIINAQGKGIETKIEIEDEIQDIAMNLVDFCRIFSILLDNAIEGAWEVGERFILVAFIKMDNTLHVVVKNSCRQTEIDTELIFEKGYTTKGGTRGTGLYTVKRMMRDYPYSLLETHCEAGIFSQTLTLREGKKG